MSEIIITNKSDILTKHPPGSLTKKEKKLYKKERNLNLSIKYLTENEIEVRMENYKIPENYTDKTQSCLFFKNNIDITGSGNIPGVIEWLCSKLKESNLKGNYSIQTEYEQSTGEIKMTLDELKKVEKLSQPESNKTKEINSKRQNVQNEYRKIRKNYMDKNIIYADQQTTGSGKTYALVSNTIWLSSFKKEERRSLVTIFSQPRKDMLSDFLPVNILKNKESESVLGSEYYKLLKGGVIPVRIKDRTWYDIKSESRIKEDIEILDSLKMLFPAKERKCFLREYFQGLINQLKYYQKNIKQAKEQIKIDKPNKYDLEKINENIKGLNPPNLPIKYIYYKTANGENKEHEVKPGNLHKKLVKELKKSNLKEIEKLHVLATIGSFDGGCFKNIIENPKQDIYSYFITLTHDKLFTETPFSYYIDPSDEQSEDEDKNKIDVKKKNLYGSSKNYTLYPDEIKKREELSKPAKDKSPKITLSNTDLELVIDEADQAMHKYNKKSFKRKEHESNYKDALSYLFRGLSSNLYNDKPAFNYYKDNLKELNKISKTATSKIGEILPKRTTKLEDRVDLILEQMNKISLTPVTTTEYEIINKVIEENSEQDILFREIFIKFNTYTEQWNQMEKENGRVAKDFIQILKDLSEGDIRINPESENPIIRKFKTLNYSAELEQFLTNPERIRQILVSRNRHSTVSELKEGNSTKGYISLMEYFLLFIIISLISTDKKTSFKKFSGEEKQKTSSSASALKKWFPFDNSYLDKFSFTEFINKKEETKKTITPEYVFNEIKFMTTIMPDQIDKEKTISLKGGIQKPSLAIQAEIFEAYLFNIISAEICEKINITLLSATFDSNLTQISGFNRNYLYHKDKGSMIYLTENEAYRKAYNDLNQSMSRDIELQIIEEGKVFSLSEQLEKHKIKANENLDAKDFVKGIHYKKIEISNFIEQIQYSIEQKKSYIVFTLTKKHLYGYLDSVASSGSGKDNSDNFSYFKIPKESLAEQENMENCGIYDYYENSHEKPKARIIIYSTKLFEAESMIKKREQIFDATNYPIILFTDNASSTGLNNYIWENGEELDFNGISFLESFFYNEINVYSLPLERKMQYLLKYLFLKDYDASKGKIIDKKTGKEIEIKELDDIFNDQIKNEKFIEAIYIEENVIFLEKTLQKLGRVTRKPGKSKRIEIRMLPEFMNKIDETNKVKNRLTKTQDPKNKRLTKIAEGNESKVFKEMKIAVRKEMENRVLDSETLDKYNKYAKSTNDFINIRLGQIEKIKEGYLDKKSIEAERKFWEKFRDPELIITTIANNQLSIFIEDLNQIITDGNLPGGELSEEMLFFYNDEKVRRLVYFEYPQASYEYAKYKKAGPIAFSLKDTVLLSDKYEHYMDLNFGNKTTAKYLEKIEKLGFFNSTFLINILKGSVGESYFEKEFNRSLDGNIGLEMIEVPDKLFENTDFLIKSESNHVIYSIDIKNWGVSRMKLSEERKKSEIEKKGKRKRIDNYFEKTEYKVIHILTPTISEDLQPEKQEENLWIIPLIIYKLIDDKYDDSKKIIQKDESHSFFDYLNTIK